METLTNYRYRGARAMVLLHEEYLRQFVETWKKAKASGVALPKTDDPNYASWDTLLWHVLRAARGYMTWMCEVLGLPDPEIRAVPEAAVIATEADQYLEHVLQQWRTPLANVEEERFERPEYPSRWNVKYCIDAMLEHAVMHPIRHRFQLMELLGER
jgi:uncharacterized damage-inducible protein DinB